MHFNLKYISGNYKILLVKDYHKQFPYIHGLYCFNCFYNPLRTKTPGAILLLVTLFHTNFIMLDFESFGQCIYIFLN